MGLFYVICTMKKIAIVFSALTFCFGCKDELNLPEYNNVEDTESPVITLVSPTKEATYSRQMQLPIRVDFTDNFEVDEVQFQLSPINFASPTFTVTKKVNATAYSLDTFYTVPSTDSIKYDVLVIVNDGVNNIATESYQFTTKN